MGPADMSIFRVNVGVCLPAINIASLPSFTLCACPMLIFPPQRYRRFQVNESQRETDPRRRAHTMKLLKGFRFQPLADASRTLKQERGVTGLETAIILIAFVVVASVFAFTVLSTGIFSAERGKETIHAGLKGARSSLALKGGVVANGVSNKTLSLADSAWTGSASTTVTADTTDKKQGTGSADMAIDADFTTGLVAYSDLSATVDLSSIDSVSLWVKYGTTTAAGDLQLRLDDTAACGSSLEDIDLPVLVANTWKLVTLAITDNSDMTAVKCVGIDLVTDDGAITLNVDEVVAQGQATSLLVTITNTLEGEPIERYSQIWCMSKG